jgi:hypothetical protein
MAKRLLLQAIVQDLRPYVVSANKSKDMMDLLKGMFEASSMEDALRVSRELKDAVLTKFTGIKAYLNNLRTLQARLKGTKFAVTDDQLIFYALDGLSEEYSIGARILTSHKDLTWAKINDELVREEIRLKSEDEKSGATVLKAGRFGDKGRKAPFSKSNGFKPSFKVSKEKKSIICYGCGKPGHMVKDCRTTNGGTNKNAFGKGSSTARENGRFQSKSSGNLYFTSTSSEVVSWILDSGATHHMVGDANLFSELDKTFRSRISTADGIMECLGIGTIEGRIVSCNEPVKIEKVLFVQGLKVNLLSMAALASRGIQCVFGKEVAHLGHVKAARVNNLYCLGIEVFKSMKAVTMQDVHRSLAHAGNGILREAISSFDVEAKGDLTTCHECLKGKMARDSFKKSSSKASDPFNVIWADVIGPIRPESYGKAKYVLILMDDFSRFVWSFLMKRKSEVTGIVRDFLRGSGAGTKVFISDNGGEFTSKEFKQMLKTFGVEQKFTVPYSPQMVGRNERQHRTLFERVRSMLGDAREFMGGMCST